MNTKKYTALFLAFCMCICWGITSLAAVTEKLEKGYDFQADTEGKTPKNMTVYAESKDGEYCLVKNFESNNVLEIKTETKQGDPAIVINRSFTEASKIAFKLYFPEITLNGKAINDTITTRVMFKDLTNNKFTHILSFKNGIMQFLGDTVENLVIGTNEWHEFELFMDEETNEISVSVDGVTYTSGKNLLYSAGELHYDNLSFRIQLQCTSEITAEEPAVVYTDDINIYKLTDTVPVITLKGGSTVYVNQGDSYIEPGYTAEDDAEGDISERVTVSGEINTNIPGTYILEYNISNSAGVEAKSVKRTVIVKKHESIEGKPQRQLLGYTFEDDTVGKAPSGLTIFAANEGESGTVQETDGKKVLRLQGIKGTGNASPAISIDKDFTGIHKIDFMCYLPEVNTGSKVKVMMKDLVTGAFIDMIEQSGSKIKFFGTEIAGFTLNAETWYNVQIYINSETLKADLRINETSYAENKSIADINYNKLSFRLQFYNYTNNTTKMTYIDDLYIYTFAKPVITLKGDSEVKVNLGETYIEAGWSAADAVDGDISSKVEVSGTVDTSTEGEYILEYNVSAKDGTKAETVSRNVIVRKRSIAAEADISAGSEQPEFPASNLNDENRKTVWKPSSAEESVVFKFDADTLIDETLVIGENIESGEWYVSNDGSSWLKPECSAETSQDGIIYKFSKWQAVKYLKYIVRGEGLGVAEIECSVKPESITVADAEKLSVPELESGNVAENIYLPERGAFGSAIIWSSSNPFVISSEGIVSPGAKDEKVVLTAELSYENVSITKIFPEVTVKGTGLYCRQLYSNDFEGLTPGKVITTPAEWGVWENDFTAVKVGDTVAAQMHSYYDNGAAVKPTLYMDRPFLGKTQISFDLYIKDTDGIIQIMFKDLTSGNFINFARIENGALKVLNEATGLNIGKEKWYNFAIENDSETSGVTVRINGSEYVYSGKLTDQYARIDYSNISFRIQVTCNSTAQQQDVYFDNFLVLSSAKPVINLKGEKTVQLTVGEEYKEVGYTAEDEIDGNITDLVKTENNINVSQPGEYAVTYTVTTKDGAASAEETRTVIVNKKNLMENAETTIDKTTDSIVITVEFKESTVADTVVMSSAAENIVLEYSADGKEWKKINASVNGRKLVFEPVDVKYIRCTSGGAADIAVLAVNVDNKSIVQLDLADLQLEADGIVTNDLVLQAKGKRGSTITWKSSDTSAVLDNGTIMKPSSNTSVVMTATAVYFDASQSKAFPAFTVKGSGKTQNGGSGGASGGSGGVSIVKNTDTPIYAPQVPAMPENTGKFSDVADTYWAKEYIESLAEKNIINGVNEKIFEPERGITREEFLKLLVASLGITADNSETSFDDIVSGEWYEKYVNAAYGAGIVNGISNNIFGIGELITRQDMAVMVTRSLEYLNKPIAEKENQREFADSQSIAAYAEKSVGDLQRAGVLSGNEHNEFKPLEALTRAQAAKVIYMLVTEE